MGGNSREPVTWTEGIIFREVGRQPCASVSCSSRRMETEGRWTPGNGTRLDKNGFCNRRVETRKRGWLESEWEEMKWSQCVWQVTFSCCPKKDAKRKGMTARIRLTGSKGDFKSRWYLSRNLFAFCLVENGLRRPFRIKGFRMQKLEAVAEESLPRQGQMDTGPW